MNGLRGLWIMVLAALAMSAWGDGKMWSVRLGEAPPTIPAQRAILKWDGREEILIIESTVKGPKGKYGWLVPLPTRPTYVRAVKPDYVARTFEQLQPPIENLPERNIRWGAVGSVLLTLLLLSTWARYRRFSTFERAAALVVEGAIGLAVFSALMTDGDTYATEAVATASGEVAKGARSMDVLDYGTIGSYHVRVLAEGKADEVDAWIRKEGIAVDPAGQKAIESYVKDGWVFLAATFRKDLDRPLPPHPLKAVFPTERPIYPMRLTGTQVGPLRLELAVVADRRAEIEGMRVWQCANSGLQVQVSRDPSVDQDVYSDWQDNLYAMAKPGDVLTYLRADLEPDEMKEDFLPAWKPFQQERITLVDRKQAESHVRYLFLLYLPFMALPFGLLACFLPKYGRALALLGIAGAVLGSGLLTASWWRSVEVVDTMNRIIDFQTR